MDYNFQQIEKAAKDFWKEQQVYKVSNDSTKPKFYVLDMFPYPSGAGLHVGHPLGYIASDIFARFKVMKGFNVLHPMGFDAFGLPAEQYALETGQHPATTTEKNIARYKEQLDNIGFNYDWSREVRTSDAKYYKWTQWIFVQLFQSWFDRKTQKAAKIESLIALFNEEGNTSNPAPGDDTIRFTAEEWKLKNEVEQRAVLMQYRLAYLDFAEVWWCEALGTVLANDEVVNGVSERGGHPVEKKKLSQWFLRITEFADRLIDSLNNLEWSEAMKEMQRNWIGKSEGASVKFYLSPTLSKGEGDASAVVADGADSGYGYITADAGAWNANIDKAKEMRHNPTEAENLLWQELRSGKLGEKFRRQHPIGSYIPDFVCLSKKLIVEADGAYHNDIEQKEYDEERTRFFAKEGYKVVRYSNEHILKDIGFVIEKIKEELASRATSSSYNSQVSLSFGEGRGEVIEVFTTRPDTIFGVDFMVLAPEHELVNIITTEPQKAAIDKYVADTKSRSERERQAEKKISGCFTGAYAIHPFTGQQIPVWISEYVLAGYGTGAIMAVPAGDDRDHAFAKHFDIHITNIFGDLYNGKAAVADKNVTIHNSDFVTGLNVKEAATKVLAALEEREIGTRKINYRLRDAGFSRQRYWGEPFPVVYKNLPLAPSEGGGTTSVPYIIDEAGANLPDAMQQLPLELPHVENYKPGPEGEGPLANVTDWVMVTNNDGEVLKRETNTMPGYAGSSWYFLRYMDNGNEETFADKNVTDYWNQVDLYIGGTEHAVGHLLYSRMWTKALFDLGFLSFDEPFKRLVNQGMITGKSIFIARTTYISKSDPERKLVLITTNDIITREKPDGSPFGFIVEGEEYIYNFHTEHRIPTSYTKGSSKIYYKDFQRIINDPHVKSLFPEINAENLKEKVLWRNDSTGEFVFGLVDDSFYSEGKIEVEKMSKSKYNVENPDDIISEYGADTFRMYEMFLGPIDVSKPWDTKGIEGVHRFLKKFWRLFNDEQTGWKVTDETPTEAELKVLHKTIQKIESDTERFSFNTAVSQFMICVNELMDLKCNKRAILEPLVQIITPYAPHIAEELWKQLGNEGSVIHASFPKWEEKYTVENSKVYPVSVNGKARTQLEFDLDADPAFVEAEVLANPVILKWLDGKEPKKFIYVKGRMINVVV